MQVVAVEDEQRVVSRQTGQEDRLLADPIQGADNTQARTVAILYYKPGTLDQLCRLSFICICASTPGFNFADNRENNPS